MRKALVVLSALFIVLALAPLKPAKVKLNTTYSLEKEKEEQCILQIGLENINVKRR